MQGSPLVISIAVVTEPSGRVLFVRRGDFYELPGGKVEDGETPLEAVVRELEEETGIRIKEKDARYQGTLNMLGYQGEPVLVHVFRINLGHPIGCGSCAWLDPGRAGTFLAPGSLEAIRKALGGKNF